MQSAVFRILGINDEEASEKFGFLLEALRYGTPPHAGLAFGLAFWGLVAATGLGAILQASTHLLIALKVAGGAYLLWLAYGSARSAMRTAPEKPGLSSHIRSSEKRLFVKGLALNLSNPKAVVAWMAALSVGLGADDHLVGMVVATLGCALIGLLIYAAYAAAFSISVIMNGYVKFGRWIDGIVSSLFAIAGIALIRSALARSQHSLPSALRR